MTKKKQRERKKRKRGAVSGSPTEGSTAPPAPSPARLLAVSPWEPVLCPGWPPLPSAKVSVIISQIFLSRGKISPHARPCVAATAPPGRQFSAIH